MFQINLVEKIKTHFFFFSKIVPFLEEHCRAGQATAHCMMDT